MSGADLSLSIGLLVALAFSVGNRRAWAWLLAAAGSYIVSTVYWRTGLPYAPFVAGLCDATVCVAVYFFGKLRWEMWMWRLFQVSVLVNILYLAGALGLVRSIGHEEYSVMLEAINWLALLWIGGTGAAQNLGATDVRAGRPWRRVHWALSALYAKRKRPAFEARQRA